MNTQINKVTPAHGLSWYVKWLSSIILIHAMAFTSLDMYPYNMYFQFTGITGWLIVGWIWKDWSLIVVNTVGSLILFAGIIHYHFFTDWMLRIYEYHLEALL